MRRIIRQKTQSLVAELQTKRYLILSAGAATFFFGFGAGALLNIYLLAINDPFVAQFRSSLTYKSAIFGDGIILPIVNMIIAAFLIRHWGLVNKKMIHFALFLGLLITAYFHVSQAVNGLVNWAMPQPWHWNMLGVWHAAYMYVVCSYMSLFYLLVIRCLKRRQNVSRDAIIVTIGILLFFVLLRLDYIAVSFSSMVPQF